MPGGGGDEGGSGSQWSTADASSQPPQRQAQDAAVAAPSSSSSYATSSSTRSGTNSASEGGSTSTSVTSDPQHHYPSNSDTFDPRYSPSRAYRQREQQSYGGQQQQHHIQATAKQFRPPLPALSTATRPQAPFDLPYMSFVQLHQPQPMSHHAQLYHAVESSRYNWDPATGEPRYAPQDLSYTGLSVGETTSRPRTPGGGPSDRRVSFQLQQPPQDRSTASLSSAVESALRSGDDMTIGDLLEMSMSSTAPSLASPGSLVDSSWSGDGPPEESDFVSPNRLETAEASTEPTKSVPRVKPFISKLEYLLSHPEFFKDCMVWDDMGTSFIICHAQPRLLSEVLPSFYQHSSLHAFTRQLNYIVTVYGFVRLSPSELISKLDITSTHDYSGWRHPSFTRDDHSKMHTLSPKPSRARAQKKVEKQEAQAVARQEAEAHRQSRAKQKQQIQQTQQQQQREQEHHLQQRYQQQYKSSAYEHPQQAQAFQCYSGSSQQQQQEYVHGSPQLEQMDDESGSDHSPCLAYTAYTLDAASANSGLQER
ncbi:BQ2448_784 [Microbotryum intermedium]|uniref:BQ2448_784 protein n=1 Tax=Microbotryum intermedium TaxID=269621 RepID=A0A238F9H1_9BASI|nr:BQ2448_784 [Microbotryum intermedium]